MVGPERSAEQSCSGRDYFAVAGWCDQNISLLRKLYDLDANNFVYGVSMCFVCSMHSESL